MHRSGRTKPDDASTSSETAPLLGHENPTPTPAHHVTSPPPAEPRAITWASLPRKDQLAVIVFARLAEPLCERSLTSYLFHQLEWFDPTLDAPEIARQAGYLTAAFAAAQCLTSMWWGHAADHPRVGRKRVLIFGLVGSALSTLGMGFATSWYMAVFFRFSAGALNGNIGVLRTMVSEIVVGRRYQARAFLLLPMCFNVGVIIGPLIGGILADPTNSLPNVFGPGSLLGGAHGVAWLEKFPYALPNLFFSAVLGAAAFAIFLGLDETHPQLVNRPDYGRSLGRWTVGRLSGKQTWTKDYGPLPRDPLLCEAGHPSEEEAPATQLKVESKPSLRDIVTRNVILTMAQRFLLALHISAFNSIFFSLLPAPKGDRHSFDLPFRFSGGLGLSSQKIGFANTIIGMIGLPLQLLLYPRLISSIGVKNSYRAFLPLSIVAYFLLPYLVLLPDDPALIWTCLSFVLVLQVTSRTFVGPATIMLVNDSAPSPNLRGTVHGVASSVSSAARIVGPTVGGLILGWGLSHNMVALPLWLLAILATINWVVVLRIKDVGSFK
ncbi:major facilitator superfamily domain-containing protein [Stachybotrys elegans]|uniref:Major facilitator superfamily domain-containing protein n=1 Tax=Stachybotrys elegans TaxID=80388 RepID=A0A8K0SJT5_9HYPO|nr:major facilitator superfamily domain-containing protein [Stachybotrys elegans]